MTTTRLQKWNRDTEIEQMAAQFLDKYFYPRINPKHTITRYTDKYHQVGGIDVSINNINFDEKCKYQGLLNKVLATPGFECSMLNKAYQIQDGWFLNDNLSTDFYAIISLSCTVDDDRQLSSSNQISAADVLWVYKKDVIDYVTSFEGHDGEITLEQLKRDAQQLRFNGDNNVTDAFGNRAVDSKGRARFKYPHKKYWLTYSTTKEEKPINLVLLRDDLEKLPHTRHFIVTKEEVRKA